MSRKDFILIASIIKDLYLDNARDDSPATVRQDIAEAFADALASTNSAFKRDLFVAAATGQCKLTARSA